MGAASLDGLWLVDDLGRLRAVNPVYCQMTGYREEELLAMSVADLEVVETREQVESHLRELATRGADRFETRHRCRDGRLIDIEVSVQRRSADGGWSLAILRDLTARRRAEAEYRESNRRYRELFAGSRDGFVVVAPTGRILDANAAFCELLGYSLDELRAMPDFYTVTPERWRAWEHAEIWCHRLLGQGNSGIYEKEYLRKDGTIVPVELQSFAVRDERGEVAYLWGVVRDISDRKRAEVAIRQAEERFRAIFDATFQFTGLLTPDGTLLEANQAALNFAGVSLADVSGRPFWDARWWAGDPARVARLRAAIARAAAGEFVRYEEVLQGAGARTAVIDFSLKPVFDAGGAVSLIVPEGRDVTEMRRTQEQMFEHDRQLRNLVRNIPGAVFRCACEPPWRVEFISDQIHSMTGLGVQDFVSGRVAYGDLVHPEDADRMARTVAEAVRAKAPFRVEHRIRHQDGSIRWVCAQGAAAEDAEGRALWLDGIHFDITEQKRSAEIIREREERYRSTLASMIDLVFVIDREDRFIDFHAPASCPPLLPPEAFLGRHVTEVLPPSIAARLVSALAALREGSREQRIDYEMVIDGTDTCWSANLSPRRDAAGVYDGATAVSRNVTEHRRLEEQLRQRDKMDAIGQLAGGIAHDFNNQLAGVLGYADLLMTRLGEPDLRRLAESIRIAATRAADLTRQLLAFSRKGRYLSVPVDLHQVIAETVALLERSIDKRIHLRQELAASPHTVLGDPTQLQNALLNLAVNARDAMPGGGTLTLITSVEDLPVDPADPELAPGRYLRLDVVDTGVGMDPSVQRHLFEPFFTTKPVGQGTGLGLAAVHGAIRSHRGRVRVSSRLGVGSTFSLFLPLLADECPLGNDTQSSVVAGGVARILVVDDEPLVRELLVELLGSLGHRVTACENAAAALGFYRQSWRDIDLVVLDMVMPGMGGRELFGALREINPRICAILSSGHGLNGEAQRILDEGAVAFIQKPYTRTELARMVSAALSGPVAARQTGV